MMEHISGYLDSVFCVEIGRSQTGVQVVTQGLQSLHSGQQLTLVLQTHRQTHNQSKLSVAAFQPDIPNGRFDIFVECIFS